MKERIGKAAAVITDLKKMAAAGSSRDKECSNKSGGVAGKKKGEEWI